MRATQRKRNPLSGEQEIGLRVGQVIGLYKMQKHFELEITKNSFSYSRREANIVAEAALDGLPNESKHAAVLAADSVKALLNAAKTAR